jgi:hypothetical protein
MGRSNSSFYTQENRQLLPMGMEYFCFQVKGSRANHLSDLKKRLFQNNPGTGG